MDIVRRMINDPKSAQFISWTELGTRYVRPLSLRLSIVPIKYVFYLQLRCVQRRRVQPDYSGIPLQAQQRQDILTLRADVR